LLYQIAVALPPLLVVLVIWDQWPLVPVWDQWFLIPFFEKVAMGEATFADVMARHQGEVHHIVVPRLVFTALAFASDWTMKLEIWGSIVLAGATLWSLLRMTAAGFDEGLGRARAIAAVFVSALAFSLVQIWNWLWGFSLMLFLINACVVIGTDVLRAARTDRFGRALALAAAGCFVASFSMAHGVLSFIALAPAVFFYSPQAARARHLAAWGACTLVTWALFLWGYSAEDAPSTGHLVGRLADDPLLLPGYLLILLGSPLAWASDAVGDSNTTLVITSAVGLVVTGGFVVGFAALWPRVSEAERRGLVAWGCIGLFSLLYAGLNTVGRAKPFFLDPAGYDLARVWLSMYATPAGLLTIATVLLAVRWGAESKSVWGVRVAAASLALVIFVNDLYEIDAPEHLEREHQTLCFELMDRWAPANTCMNFVSYADEIAALERIGWRAPRAGVSVERESWPGGIATFEPGEAGRPGTLHGAVDAEGAWALAPADAGRSAILVSRSGAERFFTYVLVDAPDEPGERVSWSIELDPRAVPRGSDALQAWLYERGSGRLRPVGSPFAWNAPGSARAGR